MVTVGDGQEATGPKAMPVSTTAGLTESSLHVGNSELPKILKAGHRQEENCDW